MYITSTTFTTGKVQGDASKLERKRGRVILYRLRLIEKRHSALFLFGSLSNLAWKEEQKTKINSLKSFLVLFFPLVDGPRWLSPIIC